MIDAADEERIFSEALSRPEPERAAFLAAACGHDGGLRASVEALLVAHTRESAFIDHTPLASLSLAPEEKPGDFIGRYRLIQRLGEGGHGVVYLAEQEKPVRRRVALKVIKLGMDTKAVMARFDAERQALALMDHANIAKVLDAGATDTGRPYFVMELVDGVPITIFCDQHRLSIGWRVRLFVQVCRALQHAHLKGVIHRDIKPSNILVSMVDSVPVPKVIDFGIAKATQGRLTEQTMFTSVEQFIGTPAYTSPEQANLNGLDIDTRSDIYSLGVLLYELLAGRTPFDGKALAQAGLDEIRRHIQEVEPPRPSVQLRMLEGAALRATAQQRGTTAPKIVNLVRGDLDWVVMRCLEKDRQRRYDTANDLALDLQRYLGNAPVTARQPSFVYRVKKLIQRHKVAFAAAVTVGVVLLTELVTVTWSLKQERSARTRAVAAEHKATSEAKKSEQVAKFLQTMLQGIGPSVALGRDTKLLREIVDQTASRIQLDLQDQPVVEAELYYTLGNAYFELGDFEKALKMHERAFSLRRESLRLGHPDIARSLARLGITKNALGDIAPAEALLREALDMQRKLGGDESPEVATTLSALATVLFDKSDSFGAEIHQRDALAMRRRNGGATPDTAGVLADLSRSVQAKGDLISAERLAREALALHRRQHGNEHPNVAHALYILGSVLYSRGERTEAELVVGEALILQRRLLGNDHPEVARTLVLLAWIDLYQALFTKADEAIKEALAIQRKTFGSQHRYVAASLLLRARITNILYKWIDSEACAREALEIYRKTAGEESLEVAYALTHLARVLFEKSNPAEGERFAQEAVRIRRDLPDPDLGYSLDNMASLLKDFGNFDEAIELTKRRMELWRSRVGDNDRLTLRAMSDLIGFQVRAGDWEAATPAAEDVARRLMGSIGPEEVETLDAWMLVAVIYRENGRPIEAAHIYEELVSIWKIKNPEDHDRVGIAKCRLGTVYLRLGRIGDAEELYSQMIDEYRSKRAANDFALAEPLWGLGKVRIQQGRYEEAEELLREASFNVKRERPNNFLRFTIQQTFGYSLFLIGRYEEAESELLDVYNSAINRVEYMPVSFRDGWVLTPAITLQRLYTAWDKPEVAKEWQEKIARLRATLREKNPVPRLSSK